MSFFSDMPGRSVPFYCDTEKESWNFGPQEVHYKAKKRKMLEKNFRKVVLYSSVNYTIFIFSTDEFDNFMQQDAHEFLNFLINHINETIMGKIYEVT